jgi:hypothetical protein
MTQFPARLPIEDTIRNSDLFTQVEDEWYVSSGQSNGLVTYVNRSRGVTLTIDRGGRSLAHVRSDDGHSSTYVSSGHYTANELLTWWFPVMRSDRAWRALMDSHSLDPTIALEYVNRDDYRLDREHPCQGYHCSCVTGLDEFGTGLGELDCSGE